MVWIAAPFAALAVLCWLSAVGHWIASLANLSGRCSLGAMLLRGYEAFNAENYTPRGRTFQKRFLYSVLGFVACCVLAAVAGIVASSAARP